jgi:rod shape-determining protein MreD
MRTFGIILLLILLFSIQTTLLRLVEISGVRPDLITIAIVFIGYQYPRGKSVLAGGLLGLAQDVLSGGIIGMNMFSKGLIGFSVVFLKESVILENIFSQFFLIAGATVLEGLTFQFLSSVFPMIQAAGGFWKDVTVLAIYNGAVGPIGFFLLRKKFFKPTGQGFSLHK